MTTIAILIPCVVALAAGIFWKFFLIEKKPDVEDKPFSHPATQLMKEYNSIPETNRPYANMKAIVEALDAKYGRQMIDNHFYNFNPYNLNALQFSWKCACDSPRAMNCKFPEYHELHGLLLDVINALKAQEHALVMIKHEGGLSEATELIARLREEKQLIQQVTKELI